MSVVYTVGTFQGPLELLLSLIESEKLPISEVSLVRVAEQFLQYVTSMSRFDSDLVSRFLAVAATLVALKAQSLLPIPDLSEEIEADAAELEYRLSMYAALRSAVRVLEKHSMRTQPLYTRKPGWKYTYTFVPDASVTTGRVVGALREILDRSREHSLETTSPELEEVALRPAVSLEQVMQSISDTIARGESFSLTGNSRHANTSSRVDALVSFLAILELIRSGILCANQDTHNADIVCAPAGVLSTDFNAS